MAALRQAFVPFLDGQSYELETIHFHTPSEHTVFRIPYAMEVQLMHRRGEHLVIVGVFIEVGLENPFIQEVLEHIPSGAESEKSISNPTINAVELLPNCLDAYYRYSGSLTVPPYDETATWIVIRDPISISVAQLEKILDVVEQNARPIQPRNHRFVLEAV